MERRLAMMSYGKVVGGHFINATISTNRKGELALSPLGFKGTPNLTADAVAAWEEITAETRGGAAGAVSRFGNAVALVALPGFVGKAASAAVDSAVDSAMHSHTVRVDWVDGKQSLIQLPDKLFQHLAILLKDRQLATPAPAAAAPIPASPSDVIGEIAQLAALRDQGALNEDEFAAKKAELLARI